MNKIGDVSRRLGISRETLRFYEAKNLISASERSAAGYRLYTEQDIQTIQFVQRCKEVGLSLSDAQELLEFKLDKSAHTCAEVKRTASEKLKAIEAKIKQLMEFRTALKSLVDSCDGSQHDASFCSILSGLEKEPK